MENAMKNKYEGMVLASFAADSLALGAHWIYDTDKIQNEFGRIEKLLPPVANSYHSTKKLGEFTHYGDQTLLLLDSLSPGQSFDIGRFATAWHDYMRNYSGYMDKASKTTLTNFESGENEYNSGSPSTDLGGPARIAPLLFYNRTHLEVVCSYAEEQTAMTHNSPSALLASRFLCIVTWHVLHNKTPRQAIETALDDGVGDITLDLRIRDVLAREDGKTIEIIKECGQACGVDNGLPGVVHLVTRYQENLAEALIQNVMAGGDSAARGLATGMILGAHLGTAAIPPHWLEEMPAYPKIQAQLSEAKVD